MPFPYLFSIHRFLFVCVILYVSFLCRKNKLSYKYSGLANWGNTVGVEQREDGVAILTSGKKQGKLSGCVAKKPSGRRLARAAGCVAGSRRPDLKRDAQARASEIRRALRKKAALAKSS